MDYLFSFYNNIGVNFKITKEKFTNETISFLDFFIQIFIPEKTSDKIRSALKNNNIMQLLKILEQKEQIRVIINKDKALTNNLRKKVLKQFK